MKRLKEAHKKFIAQYKNNGHKVTKLSCPHCSEEIETPEGPKNEVWDSIASCPNCERLYFKIVRGSLATGKILL